MTTDDMCWTIIFNHSPVGFIKETALRVWRGYANRMCIRPARGERSRQGRDGRLHVVDCAKSPNRPLWLEPLFSRLKISREATSIACFVHGALH